MGLAAAPCGGYWYAALAGFAKLPKGPWQHSYCPTTTVSMLYFAALLIKPLRTHPWTLAH